MSTAYQGEAVFSARDFRAAKPVLEVRTWNKSDGFRVLNPYGLPEKRNFDGDLCRGCASTSMTLQPIRL
jgi:hypothetical protein